MCVPVYNVQLDFVLVQSVATAKLRPCAPRYAPVRPNAPRAKKYKEKLRSCAPRGFKLK